VGKSDGRWTETQPRKKKEMKLKAGLYMVSLSPLLPSPRLSATSKNKKAKRR
jgi:hypothetical protein